MKKLFIVLTFLCIHVFSFGQVVDHKPSFFTTKDYPTSQLTRKFIAPERILYSEGKVTDQEVLLKPGIGQADLANRYKCILRNTGDGKKAGILLDFGRELHGGVEIVTGMWSGNKPLRVHLTFGESASEAMSTVGEKGATNDHAIRDFTTLLPCWGKSN